MTTITPKIGLFKYDPIQDANQTFNITKALNENWDKIDEALNNRNIGEIVTSTIPLIDAGLHLLDGSLILYGSYSGFIDYMAGLFTTNPELFCAESEWQESITANGICGKFVYDSENNTLRLPKITGFIEGTNNSEELGNIVEAGLPNITGSQICNGFTFSPTDTLVTAGAILAPHGTLWGLQNGAHTYARAGNFDASHSNSIYDNSTTVQPQSVKVLYYIVIATSTKTDVQVNIDNIMADLKRKTDTNLTNITKPAKELITSLGIPDYSKGISGPALNTARTVPYDALVMVEANVNNTYSGLLFYLRNPDGLYFTMVQPSGTTEKSYLIGSNQGTSQLAIIPLSVTVPKGYTYHIECASAPANYRVKEYPLKGASNE